MKQDQTIRILDEQTANGIAAGEVVERPASVVKELIENALDAGASRIYIDILQGGIKSIRVADNGCGMSPENAKLSFARHATSKMQRLEDLDKLRSMGFRGEALASIAAVSRVSLKTRPQGQETGYYIHIEGGTIQSEGSHPMAEGTIMEIQDLFYNTPARYKFLKRDSTEAAYIQDVVERHAFSRPDVSFAYRKDQEQKILTPGDDLLLSVIYTIWGRESAEAMLELSSEVDDVSCQGFMSNSHHTRKNRARQVFIVNGRVIQSPILRAAVDKAIQGHFVKGNYPELVLGITLPQHELDVNVHPQKTEVRFADEQKMFRAVYHSLKNCLESNSGIKEITSAHKLSDLSPEQQVPTQQLSFSIPQDEQTKGREVPVPPQALQERLPPREQVATFAEAPPVDLPLTVDKEQSKHKETSSQHDTRKEETKPALDLLAQARIIGQVFNTYLLLEAGDNFLLIDQHAAHERILYEKFLAYYQATEYRAPRQLLLQPEILEFSPLELEGLQDQSRQLLEMGFEFEQFSDRSIILRAVPLDPQIEQYNPREAFRSLVEQALHTPLDREAELKNSLHAMACKSAVKAHDILSFTEMKNLLQQLLLLQDPFHCPHGRPVIVTISRQDLEKLFLRQL